MRERKHGFYTDTDFYSHGRGRRFHLTYRLTRPALMLRKNVLDKIEGQSRHEVWRSVLSVSQQRRWIVLQQCRSIRGGYRNPTSLKHIEDTCLWPVTIQEWRNWRRKHIETLWFYRTTNISAPPDPQNMYDQNTKVSNHNVAVDCMVKSAIPHRLKKR